MERMAGRWGTGPLSQATIVSLRVDKSNITSFKRVSNREEFVQPVLDLLDVLKKNKSVKAPCPIDTRDTIAVEFSAAMKVLTPLKSRIEATDKLIDQIVYKLYALTDDEIAIVEGKEQDKQ